MSVLKAIRSTTFIAWIYSNAGIGNRLRGAGLVRVVAAAAIAVSAGLPIAVAQQPGGVLHGTVETSVSGSAEAADAPMTGHRGSVGDRLLASARRELANGEIITALQQLRTLVRRHPNTTSAAEGRRLLARLEQTLAAGRATAADGADTAASPGSQGRALALANPGTSGHVDPDPRKTRTSAWSGEYRRLQLEQDFREATGDRIFFSNASAELGARARQVLTAQANWLRRHPDVGIVVEAHADDGNSTDFNLTVARQRGEAVRDHLVREGVSADRIRLSNRGRDLKIATCPQAGCASQNRRVITIVEGQVGTSEVQPQTGVETSRAGLATPRRP